MGLLCVVGDVRNRCALVLMIVCACCIRSVRFVACSLSVVCCVLLVAGNGVCRCSRLPVDVGWLLLVGVLA